MKSGVPCFIGTLSGTQVVSVSCSCIPHRMRACCVCKASPQSTCADGAAQQVGSWTDSVSAEAHHWTGRRSEQKLGAWSPGSQTGPAGTSVFVLQIRNVTQETPCATLMQGRCTMCSCALLVLCIMIIQSRNMKRTYMVSMHFPSNNVQCWVRSQL